MALKDIMAISGHSGLFKFLSQGRQGIIVESLADGKRSNISASAKASSLSDIAIFTHDGETTLKEVLKKIKETENGGQSINSKSNEKELKTYFEKIVTDYDHERVYTSDIRKVITWYNQLQSLNMLELLDEKDEKDENEEAEPKAEAEEEKKEE